MTITRCKRAVTVVLCLALTACGHTAPHSVNVVSPATTTASQQQTFTAEPTPTAKEADSVALYSVRAVEASDTEVDTSPNDTFHRAGAWLAPSFLAKVNRDHATASVGATWSIWARHRAYLVVRASLALDNHPPDRTETAHRQVYATITPIGRDGWTGVPHTEVLFVTLTPVNGSWRLATVQPG